MTIKQVIAYGVKQLVNLNNPRLEVEVLLVAVLGRDRVFLKTHEEVILTASQIKKFETFISKRADNIPIAYILGYKDWNNLLIEVNSSTLIPRDETEILCHHILRSEKGEARDKRYKILDIGTGSGCIAIWMKKQFPNSIVSALDISKEALGIAKKNSETNKLKVNFIQSDLLSEVEENSHFDLVIANLPYVPEDLKVSKEVQKEPKTALFSGKEGFDHIRKLSKQIKEKNITFTSLWLEFLPQQKEEIEIIFSQYKVEFFGDEGGAIFFSKIS